MPDNGSSDKLPPAVPQPCVECPWRKAATAGWLGPYSAKRWLRAAHGEGAIACHRTVKETGSWDGASQCAGMASFRANVCKSPRDPAVAAGPPRDDVFGSNQEFLSHHAPGEIWDRSDMWDSDPGELDD